MWQTLQTELKDKGFTVFAVAMDSRPEAARPWIEAAGIDYPSVIDPNHHVAALYQMVNVPQAVWIDEEGRIVRPPETAGAYDGFRYRDRTTLVMPEDAVAKTAKAREIYYAAVRDWVDKGAASEFVYDPAEARARVPETNPAIAEAHAWFRLGQHLLRRGDQTQAQTAFAKARELHPDSWNIWRQTAPVDARGLATGEAFYARVDALGDRRYYAKVDMKGMP